MYNITKRLQVAWAAFNRFLMAAGVAMLVIMALSVVINVVVRIFGPSIVGVTQASEMLLVGTIMLTLAWTQLKGRHIKVDLFLSKMAVRWQHFFTAFACTVGICFFAVVLLEGAKEAWNAYVTGEWAFGVDNMYTWPAKSLVPMGCCVMCIQLLIDAIAEIRGLTDRANANRSKKEEAGHS